MKQENDVDLREGFGDWIEERNRIRPERHKHNPPIRQQHLPTWTSSDREIANLLPKHQRQRRTCYALCHILCPVSAAHTSIFRVDSNSTSSSDTFREEQGALRVGTDGPPYLVNYWLLSKVGGTLDS